MTNYQKKGYLTEDYRLFHLRSDSGTRPEFHYHEFCKILLLLSGSGGYTVDGQRYALQTWCAEYGQQSKGSYRHQEPPQGTGGYADRICSRRFFHYCKGRSR